MSVNKVILVGRLGKDPEARASGDLKIVKFSLATDRFGKGKDDGPDWHNVVCFGRTAELCEQYLTKGRQVYIEGRISYNKYEKDGETKYFTEINANEVRFLGGGEGGERSGSGNAGGGGFSNDLSGSDIPF